MTPTALGSVALLLMLLPFAQPAWCDEPRASEAQFRVCADPNNLPFSNHNQQGFENKIAELLAHERGQRVAYTWWPQRRGFLRNTLQAGVCDVVMGVPAGYDPRADHTAVLSLDICLRVSQECYSSDLLF